MHAVLTIVAAILLAGLALVLIHAANPLPALDGRTASAAFAQTDDTALGRVLSGLAAEHPGTAGIHPVPDAQEAFAARILLARAAERSLDIQYYIWRGDMTGTMLFEELHAAADRGVRVRLLLDDNGTAGLDRALAALDSHPNMEVRLFNPFVVRKSRVVGYITDFRRLNRRMHNKSFTVDNQATIIGGRNVGDEYFGAAAEGALLFTDLDVIAVGPVVKDVSDDFDRYWASDSSYPAARLLPAIASEVITELAERAALVERDPAAAAYVEAVRETPLVGLLLAGTLPFEWAPTRMVSDDPAKGLGLAAPEGLITQQLSEIMGSPSSELDLVSPYFIPTAAGVEAFTSMEARGVHLRILVNSLAATDVDAVHSGYAKRRKPLLEAGIELYEMRLLAPEGERAGLFGSGASSLHAKTFAADRSLFFVGSFNFDPRSANLNTELGFVIASPVLADRLAKMFDDTVPVVAYEVRLSGNGDLYWIERRDGDELRYDTEPGTSFLQRAFVSFLALLPIEWLL